MRHLAVLIGFVLAGPVSAEPLWRVDPAASSIAFRYAFAGAPQEGRFTEVSGEGHFEAARPEATRFTLAIPAASLDLGHWAITAFALSAEWFDAQTHPEARYRLSSLSLAPDGSAMALGDLTIKGTLEVIEVPLVLEIGEAEARARGTVAFDPRRFGVGAGPSALLVDIGDTVTVSFDIVARPAEGADAIAARSPGDAAGHTP